jgi:hypothetical protein
MIPLCLAIYRYVYVFWPSWVNTPVKQSTLNVLLLAILFTIGWVNNR